MPSPPLILGSFLLVVWLTPAIAGLGTLPTAGSLLPLAGLIDATALIAWACWSLPPRVAMERAMHRAVVLGGALLLV
jgi:hypothetical protein